MSKSKGNTIGLLDEPDAVLGKLRGAVTDPQRLRRTDPGRPEVCNIWTLHGSFTSDDKRKEIYHGCTTAGLGCVDCKKILGANLLAHTEPMRAQAATLRRDPDAVRDILSAGNRKAADVAGQTMEIVRERVGLWHV
jgi:tryptophanyl-tRNA synthetase